MSAIGSVMDIRMTPVSVLRPESRACRVLLGTWHSGLSTDLPARLGHARNVATERELADTDAAELKLAEKRARPAAHLAAVHLPGHEFRLTLRFDDHRCFGHLSSSITFRTAYRAREEGSAPARRSAPW